MFSLVPTKLTVAQNNASQQVFLPITQLNFIGQQGATLNRTLIVIGITNQSVSVTLVATDIYDNAEGNTISASSININPASFNLSQANEQTINISINTSGVPIGTYQGAIALTSTNATTTTTTNIPVTVYIEPLTSVPTQQQVYLPISQLNFVGEQGSANINRTLTVVGFTNQTVSVTLVPTDLYDNTTGNVIKANLINIDPESFNLSQTNMTVNISIDTSGVALGTYQGVIVLTSTNATTTVTTGIPITVNIETASSSLTQQVYLPISQLNFVGQQGVANLDRTLVVVGLTNQTINVKLVPTDLYDNTTGKTIPASSVVIDPSSFTLSQSNMTVNISINASGVALGTYQGVIVLTSTNATTTVTTGIPITVNIETASASLTQQQVYLPTSQLNFVGAQGSASISRTLTVVGFTNQTVSVTLVRTDLYDNTTGNVIKANLINIDPDSFNLSQTNITINISINTSGIASDTLLQAATYQGVIVLTSTNATTTVTTGIPVTVKIEPIYFPFTQWIFFSILVSVFISLFFGEVEKVQFRFTKFVVILFGVFAAGAYFILILSASLTDPGNIIYTALIIPFIGYLIYYVKDLRADRKSLEDTALGIRNAGIQKDVGTLVDLMGELSTHYGSFKSVYHKDGSISEEVWKKERKEGITVDFPLLRLEQYYAYITIYNQHYLKGVKALALDSNAHDETFEKFRKKYAELESLLYVNLQYDLGNLTALSLSPLKTEYPRISRALLNNLVDAGVLPAPNLAQKTSKALRRILKRNPENKTALNLDKENSKALKTLEKIVKNNPVDEDAANALKLAQYPALAALQDLAQKNPEAETALTALNKSNLSDKVKNSEALKTLTNIATNKPTTDTDAANALKLAQQPPAALTALQDLRKKKYKDKINNWGLSSKDLKRISKEIYRGENTQKFLGYVEVQFNKKYEQLKQIGLLPLSEPEQQKEEPQIKGTFTVDVKSNKSDESKSDKKTPK
jgi:hypothetical protein